MIARFAITPLHEADATDGSSVLRREWDLVYVQIYFKGIIAVVSCKYASFWRPEPCRYPAAQSVKTGFCLLKMLVYAGHLICIPYLTSSVGRTAKIKV